jgi:breast cancer 2 susceptibility protein
LRIIVAQDVPASCPMVLCVSDIIWPEPASTGHQADALPEIEVTDGWYRIRVQIDRPLARAIKKGTLRIGRKIAIAGARVGFPFVARDASDTH